MPFSFRRQDWLPPEMDIVSSAIAEYSCFEKACDADQTPIVLVKTKPSNVKRSPQLALGRPTEHAPLREFETLLEADGKSKGRMNKDCTKGDGTVFIYSKYMSWLFDGGKGEHAHCP